MILEFALQQFAVYAAKGNTEELENEILKLKARLYDRSQEEDAMDKSEDDSATGNREDEEE